MILCVLRLSFFDALGPRVVHFFFRNDIFESFDSLMLPNVANLLQVMAWCSSGLAFELHELDGFLLVVLELSVLRPALVFARYTGCFVRIGALGLRKGPIL